MSIRIKVPILVNYKTYPYSVEATALSKKQAYWKASSARVITVVVTCLASALIGLLVMNLLDVNAVRGIYPMIWFGLSIWAGIDVNRLIDKWYDIRIQEAAQRDLEWMAIRMMRQKEQEQ